MDNESRGNLNGLANYPFTHTPLTPLSLSLSRYFPLH